MISFEVIWRILEYGIFMKGFGAKGVRVNRRTDFVNSKKKM
jgi:hypothetical protein